MRRLFMIALAAVLALALGGSPAAAESPFQCDPTEMCLYADYNYSGSFVDLHQARWDAPNQNRCVAMSAVWHNNVASSVWNRTSYNIAIMDSGACGGSAIIVLPGQKLPDLRAYNYNDRVSGVVRVP